MFYIEINYVVYLEITFKSLTKLGILIILLQFGFCSYFTFRSSIHLEFILEVL